MHFPAWILGLLLALLLCAPQARAQVPPRLHPELPTMRAGEQARTAELAVTALSRQDLQAWWTALRRIDGSNAALPATLLPPEEVQAWRQVDLPDIRQRAISTDFSGPAEYQMRWYRFRYRAPDDRWPTSVALYSPKVVGMATAVLVRTEAGWRPIYDNQAGAREQWVRPLWALIPGALTALHEGQDMEIVLAVPVHRKGFYTVTTAWLGAREDLEPMVERRWALQIGVPQATGLTLVVLALFSITLWWCRRQEPAYLLFTLASLAWLLRNLHYHLDMPRSLDALDWFWWLTHASMSWVMLLTFMFALRFVPTRYRRFERFGLGFVVVTGLLTLPTWGRFYDTVVAQHLANGVVGILGTGFMLRVAWRARSRELWAIVIALVIGLGLGVHDLGLLAGWGWPEHIYLMPFSTLIIVASFLYAVRSRYLGALNQVERANEHLAQRLSEQGRQLSAQHEQLREAERQQALLLERQRLMQDMHDGLGSSLLSAMVAVEQGRMEQPTVVEVLRECVDDLRLVIDSLEPVGHDLVSLLATMRYRLAKRLQGSGLVMEWDVQDLPPLPWLEPPDALHVLRLLQEALNNVLKHARAQRVRIATRDLGDRIEIRVEDDGQGFDMASARKGRGLRNQVKRVQRLGGTLHVDSAPGLGTRLSLRLPVSKGEDGTSGADPGPPAMAPGGQGGA
ncbi:sensor histidine kinase [Mitsuaria sp. WAJ17]|uniref:sensor histidine kinase n=1 Tax=Mitsuaria sp. WAJ17 TaxID=2761452 RepID=UPI0016046543|nr:sensor histidine kinase [Mitsuaria sp. WAJ17]MBB2486125.1 sensor histidine kinase [Mitsuaria sp. WAJ17]